MTRIQLDHITRIEGHANLRIKIENSTIEDVELAATEGARFFEAIVKALPCSDAHLVMQRICGICSVSHTLAAIKAVENALGVKVSEQTKILRELMAIGSVIQSHSLHLYLLSLPDYLGYSSGLDMADKYKTELMRGLGLKKLGNELDRVIGGREIHPVTCRVGGFSTLPTQEQLDILHKLLDKSRNDALRTAELFGAISYPRFKRPTEYVSLKTEDRYPLMEGNLMFSNGLEVPQEKYLSYLKEATVPYSNAKHSTFEKRPYYVGALARVNNNADLLSKGAQKCLEKYPIRFPSYNPFHNNYAQAIEIVHYIERALEIMKGFKVQDERLPVVRMRAGRGVAIIEAPGGLLIHDYKIDAKGMIEKANVVTPTAQNLKNIEDDIYRMLPRILSFTEEQITLELEKLIRSYDPCMSCAVH
jgi:sulfhydrogenase subunit alpha